MISVWHKLGTCTAMHCRSRLSYRQLLCIGAALSQEKSWAQPQDAAPILVGPAGASSQFGTAGVGAFGGSNPSITLVLFVHGFAQACSVLCAQLLDAAAWMPMSSIPKIDAVMLLCPGTAHLLQ